MLLHGFFGRGTNLAGLARELVRANPRRVCVLVDLRLHGRSQGAPRPHTVEATADDVARLVNHLRLPVGEVIGHSFGGKVALAYVERAAHPPRELWLLDSCPGASTADAKGAATEASSDAEGVLRMLRAVREREPFASREAFIDLVSASGYSRAIAEWLAMNLRQAGDGLCVAFDLVAMGELLEDYRRLDLWTTLEAPTLATHIHVVVAGRSTVFKATDRARLTGIAATSKWVTAHSLERAGHWLHVEAAGQLLALMGETGAAR